MAVELSDSEILLRAVAHDGFVVAWSAGADGAFHTPQPAWEAFTGQHWDEHKKHGWLGVVSEKERAPLLDAIRSGVPTKMRASLWSAAARRAVPVVFSWRERTPGSESSRWLGVALPVVAERVSLEQALQKNEREFEEFAAIASHDLREPIRGIANFASFVLEDHGAALEGAGQDKLRTIMRLAARMNAQLDALMEYCSLRASALCPRRTDLNELVRKAAFKLGCTPDQVVITRPLPDADCDAGMLTTVFSKLIHNGLKFNQSGAPCVELDSRAEEGVTVITVRDNGIGIVNGQSGRLFHMFKRLNPRERFEGTGAGLAIARRIIELHGGRIWVDSEHGRGATFCFTLPHAGIGAPIAGVHPVHHAH